MRFSHHSHEHGRDHGHGPHGHRFGPRGGRHGYGRRGWGDSDEGRGRRRRVFDSNELKLVLLKLIADQPRHGYELIRAIEDLTGGFYVPSPGVVYPTLTMLQEMGQIEEAPSSAAARKPFAVTAEGTEHLAARKQEVDALFARLAELANVQQRTDGGPVRRAMQNLRMVLINRLERGDTKPETLHDMAAILDEAAQKIERL